MLNEVHAPERQCAMPIRYIIGARDYLWRQSGRLFSEFHKRVVDEKIPGAYIDLLRINEALATSYQDAFDKLGIIEKANEESMLLHTQQVVLSFDNRSADRVTAQMGNKLREAVARDREKFTAQVAAIVVPLQRRNHGRHQAAGRTASVQGAVN